MTPQQIQQMLPLELVKKQVREDEDHNDDLIQTYIAAALKAFETRNNRKLYPVDEDIPSDVSNGIHFDEDIKTGALFLIGHWYANPEAVVTGTIATELPLSTGFLWESYRYHHL